MSKKQGSNGYKTRKQLQEELEALQAQLGGSNTSTENSDKELRSDEYIQVMSMIPWGLNLSTGEAGRRPYSFTSMFSVKRIMYRDIVNILENHFTFAEKGLFLILDERVVRQHGLDEAYEKLMQKETFERILSEPFEKVKDVINSANDRQKNTIAHVLIKKVAEGEDIDMNVIYLVSQATSVPILEKAEALKKKNSATT